ncbi:unnamed protein product [Caenorhabditis auriculariae]|uniref:Ammonium transporter AmtB-like domain-containing protein n=1 Tax=Caenorhabditis auriculariae TaxID=2777116 RepID=A0A8S1HTQ2_9PELO|nr:unnamed protein product [Caenorhabditis auriculariae]
MELNHISVVQVPRIAAVSTSSPFSNRIVLGVKENLKWTSHNPKRMGSALQTHQFTVLLLLLQITFFVLFAKFGKYARSAMPDATPQDLEGARMTSLYPMFQDTHVMIFIGFGFLMTFLKRYGFSAVSINLLLASFTIQWAMLIRGFLSLEDGHFTISLEQLLTADFASAVILISMGAMLGKLSPMQYILMSLLETPVAIVTEHVVLHHFHVNDVGGSINVHMFGAYFGLACAKAFAKKPQRGHENEGSTYHTDIFAMIGSVFLWIFWPSFNAAVAATEEARQRAVANTFLSLVACTVMTFIVSQALDKHRRFDMVHIANSTLAGGVAVGTVANVVVEPYHALLIGAAAGTISVIGYKLITPFLSNKLGVHDTCGVHNLHGMPGVLSGLVSVLLLLTGNPKVELGTTYSVVYPAMDEQGQNISASAQAVNQLVGVGIVLLVSVVSGFITGFILRLKIWNQVRDTEYFADGDFFETPGDYDFTSRIISSIDRVEVNEYQPLPQKTV